MAKPGLVEPKFPVVSKALIETDLKRCYLNDATTPWWRNALSGEHPLVKRGKGTKWEPKRTERLMNTNTGSPTRREPHGDGVPIVLK